MERANAMWPEVADTEITVLLSALDIDIWIAQNQWRQQEEQSGSIIVRLQTRVYRKCNL